MMKNPIKFVLILSAVLLVSLCCNENPKFYYPKFEDAKRDGALERDWWPKILPTSAREIIEQHNIDTNTVWMKFNADKSDLKTLLEQLRILTKKEIDKLFPFKHPKKWWKPTDNNKHFFHIVSYDWELEWADGRTDTITGYFFIDMKKAICYYYSPPF